MECEKLDHGMVTTYQRILPALVMLGMVGSAASILVLWRPSLRNTVGNRLVSCMHAWVIALLELYVLKYCSPLLCQHTGMLTTRDCVCVCVRPCVI